jgi:hypothetical protein
LSPSSSELQEKGNFYPRQTLSYVVCDGLFVDDESEPVTYLVGGRNQRGPL